MVIASKPVHRVNGLTAPHGPHQKTSGQTQIRISEPHRLYGPEHKVGLTITQEVESGVADP